jgi:hypothetical protein
MSSDGMTSARALASRRNGARSRGPRTPAGKARVARNALKHGLSARRAVLLDDEDAALYAAFERAALKELAPVGEFQADLVKRMVSAAWRARRADRLEAGLLRYQMPTTTSTDERVRQDALGLGLIRDSNGPRALEVLVRYRGSLLAELFPGARRPQGPAGPGLPSPRASRGGAALARLRNETNPRTQVETEPCSPAAGEFGVIRGGSPPSWV